MISKNSSFILALICANAAYHMWSSGPAWQAMAPSMVTTALLFVIQQAIKDSK